jgi:hypothetical protein
MLLLLLLLPALSSWARVGPLGNAQEASLMLRCMHAVRCCALLVLGRVLLRVLADAAAQQQTSC